MFKWEVWPASNRRRRCSSGRSERPEKRRWSPLRKKDKHKENLCLHLMRFLIRLDGLLNPICGRSAIGPEKPILIPTSGINSYVYCVCLFFSQITTQSPPPPPTMCRRSVGGGQQQRIFRSSNGTGCGGCGGGPCAGLRRGVRALCDGVG